MHESIAFAPIIEALEILTGSFFGGKEKKIVQTKSRVIWLYRRLWMERSMACRYRKLYFVFEIYYLGGGCCIFMKIKHISFPNSHYHNAKKLLFTY